MPHPAKMLKTLVLLLCAVAGTVGVRKTYENYKVFRITPTSNEQVKYLQFLDRKYNDYQYWVHPSVKFQSANLMVSPRKLHEFSLMMNITKMDYQVHIENVQALIDKENPADALSRNDSAVFSWTRYHTYEEINHWLDSLGEKYSQVEVVKGGKSHEGRDIKGVKLSFGQKEKPKVFVEGGIHANEWLGPATVTYIIDQFLTSNNPQIRKLATTYDWYFFPVSNPDGYVYAFTTDRMWRKTRVPNENGCYGVDPNRNWDYQWMSTEHFTHFHNVTSSGGASDDPCHNTYAGKKPFSEMETKTLSQYLSSISNNLFAFISFHTFGQHLLLSYGYTLEHLDNYDELYLIGKKMIETLEKRYGTKYDVGNIPEVLYIDSGSSMDWVKGTLKTPITYTYELRDSGYYGFLIPAEFIIPNGKEVLDSFLTLFEESAKLGYPKKLFSNDY